MSQLHYLFILLHFIIALILAIVLLIIPYLLGMTKDKFAEMLKEYECGFNVFDSAAKLPFDVQFYIVGLLFLIFDLEVAVMFPWVLNYPDVPLFDYVVMIIFLSILTGGFAYEWSIGVLNWPTLKNDV